jgi:hypothetical protein
MWRATSSDRDRTAVPVSQDITSERGRGNVEAERLDGALYAWQHGGTAAEFIHAQAHEERRECNIAAHFAAHPTQMPAACAASTVCLMRRKTAGCVGS